MQESPICDKLNEPVTTSLEYNLARLRDVLRIPQNADIMIRRITVSGFATATVFIDGMVNSAQINLHMMEPMMRAAPHSGDTADRIDWLLNDVLTASSVQLKDQLDEIVEYVLRGDAALLVDGCASAVIVDVKGYPRRNIERPVNETVIIGPHEAFVENMRMNLTLIRRIVNNPRLVVESHKVGTGVKTAVTMLYLDGVANEQVLAEFRRRLENLDIDFIQTAGELEQLIEDSPYSIIPQVIRTERPDRAASFLISGMVVLLVDGSPVCMAGPASLSHLIHTPDLNTMRFPYGAYKRVVLMIGLVMTAFLPALYLSLIMFHNEVLPLALMTSIYETQSRVPIPMIYEMVFMSIAFDLIIEAGARMPGVLSNGLSVVSALIIGQAVVTADLVSPLMIVVIAVSSLGSLIMPEYSLSVALRMLQTILIVLSALGGFYALVLAIIVLGVELVSTTSFGVPFMWAYTPARMHDPDTASRYPIWQQRVRMYLSNPGQILRSFGRMRAWDTKRGAQKNKTEGDGDER